jgi:hypothetical protein
VQLTLHFAPKKGLPVSAERTVAEGASNCSSKDPALQVCLIKLPDHLAFADLYIHTKFRISVKRMHLAKEPQRHTVIRQIQRLRGGKLRHRRMNELPFVLVQHGLRADYERRGFEQNKNGRVRASSF